MAIFSEKHSKPPWAQGVGRSNRPAPTMKLTELRFQLLFRRCLRVARRLLTDIARAGLRFAFHSWGTALEVMAAAHLGICWPESVVAWLEYPCYSEPSREGMYPFPLAAEILKEPLEIDHGDLLMPRAPGLGVTVDESVIERYPWIPGPWSYFRTDSPAVTRAVTSDHSVQWEQRSAG